MMFTSNQVLRLAGCTYRQLDYWVRIGAIAPSRDARGSGSSRGFTLRDAATVRMCTVLFALGADQHVVQGARRDLDRDPVLWDRVVVVTPAGRVWPIIDGTAPEGYLISLPGCEDYVRDQLGVLEAERAGRYQRHAPIGYPPLS